MNIVDTINSGAFNQISTLYATMDSLELARDTWKLMGYRQWTMDYCRQTGPEPDTTVTAILAFNFDIIPGFQFELLSWEPKIGYPSHMQPFGAISHMAYYTQDVAADVKDIRDRFGVEPWYKFVTLDHSNPALQGKTRFKEAVWHIPEVNMSFKAVQKIPWNGITRWEEDDGESPVDLFNKQLMSNIKEAGLGG